MFRLRQILAEYDLTLLQIYLFVCNYWLINYAQMRYCTQEITLFREDILSKMRRNCIIPPKLSGEGDEISMHLLKTLIDQAHLSPLPLHVSPLYWEYDQVRCPIFSCFTKNWNCSCSTIRLCDCILSPMFWFSQTSLTRIDMYIMVHLHSTQDPLLRQIFRLLCECEWEVFLDCNDCHLKFILYTDTRPHNYVPTKKVAITMTGKI